MNYNKIKTNFLIVDAGSTKTEWLFYYDNITLNFCSNGINPIVQNQNDILEILKDEVLCNLPHFPEQIFYYGAGCNSIGIERMRTILQACFPTTSHIEIASDLLAAAHALCGRDAGQVCILGTGANSGLYDGRQFTKNVPPLGYILGDEGSGTVLGKTLLAGIFKQQFSPHVIDAFFKEYPYITVGAALQRVYHEAMPNRYLASFTPFLLKMIREPEIENLVVTAFETFFLRNLLPYQRQDLPVHFVGSIAHYFSYQLFTAASTTGFTIGKVLQKPIALLLSYHLSLVENTD